MDENAFEKFDHSVYQQFHHQKDLINPFKNFPIEKTPVNFLIFTDSPQFGTQTRDQIQREHDDLTSLWKEGDFDLVNRASIRAMGAYKVAHEARQHGFTVQVIDHMGNLCRKSLEKVLEKFVGEKTLLIGVGNTFRFYDSTYIRPSCSNFDVYEDYTIEERKEVIEESQWNRFFSLGGPADRQLKQFILDINPNIKFILGGAFTTPNQGVPNEQEGMIDYINLGYGDVTVPKLLRQLKDNSNESAQYPVNSKGLYTLMDAKSELDIQNSTMEWLPEDHVLKGEILPLEVGRGCIFKCRFCSFPLNGKQKGESLRGIEAIEDEILYNYHTHGTTHYWLTDDTFNDDHDKVVAWYEMSQRLPFKLSWNAYIRWDLVYMNRNQPIPQAKLLADSGARQLVLGIETVDPECAKDIGKGLNPELQFEFHREMKQTYMKDVKFMTGIIAGLPSDTKDTLKYMSNFLSSDKNQIDALTIQPLHIRDIGENATSFTLLSESEFSQSWQEWGYEETTVDMHGNPIPEQFLEFAYKMKNVVWKNSHGLTFYDVKKYATSLHLRLRNIHKQRTAAIFHANGFPYHDPRLFIPPTEYDEFKPINFNYRETAKINQYFYNVLSFNKKHQCRNI